MKSKTAHPKRQEIVNFVDCELEIVEGLVPFALDELRNRFPRLVQVTNKTATAIQFRYAGDLRSLHKLRLAQAAYSVEYFAVPRPRALLGDAHWRRFMAQIRQIVDLLAPNTFQSFSLSAAGSDSSVMQRIRQEIGTATGLPEAEKGDLWIRIRPAKDGWETMVRLHARPIATRAWRVCNYEAALNATVAHAMALLSNPNDDQHVVNLGCGSGSLLIEHRSISEVAHLVGIDHDDTLLKCAEANIAASGLQGIELLNGNMLKTPFETASMDALLADLPFGQNVGSHEDNTRLYPAVLREAARIAKPDACFVLITHEVNLIESLLRQSSVWQLEQSIRVTLRGLHPRIYVLRRANQTT